MFMHQTDQYSITADDYQWILIWHPDGPKYQQNRDGSYAPLPKGRRSYFSSLHTLTSSLLDRKARLCGGLDDLRERLGGFVAEMKAINRLEQAKEKK
jgi:hypothetical protein